MLKALLFFGGRYLSLKVSFCKNDGMFGYGFGPLTSLHCHASYIFCEGILEYLFIYISISSAVFVIWQAV